MPRVREICCLLVAVATLSPFPVAGRRTYVNQWAAHIPMGLERAKRLADDLSVTLVAEIIPDSQHYLFQSRRTVKRSVRRHLDLDTSFRVHRDVRWHEQQTVKRRKKRTVTNTFNDPSWPQMWYLDRPGLDMNVKDVWFKMGYTGAGIVISILDDGIDFRHPDLSRNYDPEASYDINDDDYDPTPRPTSGNENKHGTRCAGEVAAVANNSICSVGVAFNASIGGIRMLDGTITDAVEARSLSYKPQHVHIYSSSWGPDDDGRTVDGPGRLAKKAFLDGIDKGRGGLGSIFIWASGNGGNKKDNCNCDGYATSIFTISISSTSENGLVPWYSENCSSTLASTYSSGASFERQIITTDLHDKCTQRHTGTSASAPLAAGLVALALEANPQLSWRDVQHIIVNTANKSNLQADDWVQNGVGRFIPLMPSTVYLKLFVDGCSHRPVVYLEHVQSPLTIQYSHRGALEIYLTSPAGTTSKLLGKRENDSTNEGFHNWIFMSTHFWGENPVGEWILKVVTTKAVQRGVRDDQYSVSGWRLELFGTVEPPFDPAYVKSSVTTQRNAHNMSASSVLNWTLQLTGSQTAPPDVSFLQYNTAQREGCAIRDYFGLCIACDIGYVQLDHNCVIRCPAGYYNNPCKPCHVACSECFGGSASECDSCRPDFLYDRAEHACIDGVSSRFTVHDFLYTTLAVVALSLLTYVAVFCAFQKYSSYRLKLCEPTSGQPRNSVAYTEIKQLVTIEEAAEESGNSDQETEALPMLNGLS